MTERVLTEVAAQLLSRHAPSCLCFRCRSLRDLLDARAAIVWITGTNDVASVIAGATAARAAAKEVGDE